MLTLSLSLVGNGQILFSNLTNSPLLRTPAAVAQRLSSQIYINHFGWEIQRVDHKLLLKTGWMVVHFCLQKSGRKARSRLGGPCTQWALVHGIIIIIIIRVMLN